MTLALALSVVLTGMSGPDFRPIDEARKDASFAEFRTNVLAALEKPNYEYIKGRIADDIYFSFGGMEGKSEFLEYWAWSGEDRRELWTELKQVLKLGGSFQDFGSGRTFVAPYVFSDWPEEYDAFEYMAMIRTDAPLYAGPNASAARLATLGYDIVGVVFEDAPDGWVKVRSPAGQVGFVRQSDCRSAIDFRAHFKKIDGSWMMTMFIAGD